MPIITSDRGTPGWWLQQLARKLEIRNPRLQALDDRMRGEAPLPHVDDNVKEAYRRFQRKARTNLAELIIESARDRMTPIGFRTAASADDKADKQAMRIWNANGLAVESSDVHENFLGLGDAYVIIGRGEGDTPLITGEDPRQVVTMHDPTRQRDVRAALKVFHDDEERRDYAFLYLPGERYVAVRDVRRTASNPTVRFNASAWDWDDDRGGPDGEALSDDGSLDDFMPVVRFRNRRGVGDFERHTDLLDRIDHQVLQRLVIATMQAFRQRAVKGELPSHDDDGNEIDYDKVFEAGPGALWEIPAAVELWESGVVDLGPILSAVKDDLRMLSAVTKTPLNSLMPDEAAQSAEGASFMREGLVFRVEDRIARAAEGWRDVIAGAFRMIGDTERADRGAIEVMWASAERQSLAEKADAASKAQDMPWRSRMIHIWGFSPDQVDAMETERAQDALLGGLAGSTDAPAAAPTTVPADATQ